MWKASSASKSCACEDVKDQTPFSSQKGSQSMHAMKGIMQEKACLVEMPCSVMPLGKARPERVIRGSHKLAVV